MSQRVHPHRALERAPPAAADRHRLGTAAALAAVPLLVLSIYILRVGQPVPYWDEWLEPADNAIKVAEGTLGWRDIVRPYNDSRPVLTNLLTATSAAVLGWDLIAERFVRVGLATVTLLVTVALYRRPDLTFRPAVVPVLALLVFTPTQRTNFLWSVGDKCFLVTFVVLAIWAAARRHPRWRWTWVAAATAFALCATFSFANGMIAWVLVPGVVLMSGTASASRLLVWAGLAAGVVYLYSGFEPHDRVGMWNPFLLAAFVSAFVANPLIAQSTTFLGHATAAAIGAGAIVLLAANCRLLARGNVARATLAPWLALAAFTLTSGLAAGYGRGLTAALADRFATLAIPFWLAFTVIAAEVVLRTKAAEGSASRHPDRLARARARLGIANRAAAVMLLALLVYSSARSLVLPPTVTAEHAACLRAAPRTRDASCLAGVHPAFALDPVPPGALAKIDRLARLRLAAFRE